MLGVGVVVVAVVDVVVVVGGGAVVEVVVVVGNVVVVVGMVVTSDLGEAGKEQRRAYLLLQSLWAHRLKKSPDA